MPDRTRGSGTSMTDFTVDPEIREFIRKYIEGGGDIKQLERLTPENVARGDFKDAELLEMSLPEGKTAEEIAETILTGIEEAGGLDEFVAASQTTKSRGTHDNWISGRDGEEPPTQTGGGDGRGRDNWISGRDGEEPPVIGKDKHINGMQEIDGDGDGDMWDERPQYEIPDEVQQMLDEYNTGAGKIEGLYETSRDEILGEARRARKESIGALKSSQDEALDIFRGRAYGNMPGYQQSLEQYGAQMAGGVRSVRERAGAGGAGLGAVADIYSSQQQGINQLGIANAQYMGARQGELGEMVRQTGLDMSGAYRTLAQDYINANLQSTGQLGGAYQAGTGMRTAGMAQMANYKDVQFGLNEAQPYEQELQFNIDEMRRTDPFEAEMAMNLAKYGVQYQGWQQATQGVTNATQSMWNAPAKGAGQWAQAYQVDQWLGGPPRK